MNCTQYLDHMFGILHNENITEQTKEKKTTTAKHKSLCLKRMPFLKHDFSSITIRLLNQLRLDSMKNEQILIANGHQTLLSSVWLSIRRGKCAPPMILSHGKPVRNGKFCEVKEKSRISQQTSTFEWSDRMEWCLGVCVCERSTTGIDDVGVRPNRTPLSIQPHQMMRRTQSGIVWMAVRSLFILVVCDGTADTEAIRAACGFHISKKTICETVFTFVYFVLSQTVALSVSSVALTRSRSQSRSPTGTIRGASASLCSPTKEDAEDSMK